MARYGTTTSLPPRQVILMAREHFGPDSRIGLPISEESWNKVTFEGAGGAVSVTALPKAGELGATDVEIVSREYDYWAERFLVRLANANAVAPLRVLWQRLARAVRRR
jgi:hypothetical protein